MVRCLVNYLYPSFPKACSVEHYQSSDIHRENYKPRGLIPLFRTVKMHISIIKAQRRLAVLKDQQFPYFFYHLFTYKMLLWCLHVPGIVLNTLQIFDSLILIQTCNVITICLTPFYNLNLILFWETFWELHKGYVCCISHFICKFSVLFFLNLHYHLQICVFDYFCCLYSSLSFLLFFSLSFVHANIYDWHILLHHILFDIQNG